MSALRVEWLKLRGYKPFWWVLITYPLAIVGLSLMGLGVEQRIMRMLAHKSQAGTAALNAAIGGSPFGPPTVWNTLAFLASFFHFLPCVLILFTICLEFEYRTHRQNLLDGWSRTRFLASKAVLVVGLSLFCTATVAAAVMAVGLRRGNTLTTSGSEVMGSFALQALGYGCFCLLVALWTGRGLLSLAVFLVYTRMLEPVAGWLLGNHVHPTLGYCLPIECFNALVPLPYFHRFAKDISPDRPTQETFTTLALVYVGLFLLAAWTRFRRQDL